MPSVLCLPHPFPPSSHIVCLSVPPAEAKGTKFQAGPAVVPRCGCFLHELTAPWGLPCTVSADTCLFPPDLNPDLDNTQLAATPGIKSCFLHAKVGLSEFAVVEFAKELKAERIFTVKDFLGANSIVACTRRLVEILDRHLALYPDLPENKHAAPGTCAGCEAALA